LVLLSFIRDKRKEEKKKKKGKEERKMSNIALHCAAHFTWQSGPIPERKILSTYGLFTPRPLPANTTMTAEYLDGLAKP
jgi:hypothetical protein